MQGLSEWESAASTQFAVSDSHVVGLGYYVINIFVVHDTVRCVCHDSDDMCL